MSQPKDAVVVITGASSGIGRELAVQIASRGGTVVLAARREEGLEDTAERCRERGGRALVVPTDVTVEAEVERLAEAAVDAWGRIDAWVNNAGVTVFAPLESGPFDEHRRVIETNLYGAMYGARAAVRVFRRQGHGTLVNVGSILSKIGQPFVPSYVISKFALRGLSEALRVELADENDIHVCTIFPYAIDTPHFDSAANEVGYEAHAMPPMQSPEKVARAIVGLLDRPRRERHVPRWASLGLALHALLPRTTERLLLHALREFHFGAPTPRTRGNLEASRDVPSTHGHRPPRIAFPAFVAWAVREIVRIELGFAQDALGLPARA